MKIKLSILNKFHKLTGDEIDILIYIAQFQNNKGEVCGMSCKDVCGELDIHRSNFYKLLRSLEDKGFITVDYSNDRYGLWNMKINNNVFESNEDYKEGYINVNLAVLHCSIFRGLSKSEKLIIIHFLTRHRSNQHSFKVTWEKLMEVTGCARDSVRRFIKRLMGLHLFSKMTYTPNGIQVLCSGAFFKRRLLVEKDVYNSHMLTLLLEEKKAEYDIANFKEMLIIFKQYAKRMSFEKIMEKVARCIKNMAELSSKYVHHLIGLELGTVKRPTGITSFLEDDVYYYLRSKR